MRDAIGGSLLLNIVIIFLGLVILFFAGIMAYSKAYKVKNRIIEMIEANNGYPDPATLTDPFILRINEELRRYGYRDSGTDRCVEGSNLRPDDSQYRYCVYSTNEEHYSNGTSYEVVTYVHFDFPIIGDMLVFPVRGETKVLNKSYDY